MFLRGDPPSARSCLSVSPPSSSCSLLFSRLSQGKKGTRWPGSACESYKTVK